MLQCKCCCLLLLEMVGKPMFGENVFVRHGQYKREPYTNTRELQKSHITREERAIWCSPCASSQWVTSRLRIWILCTWYTYNLFLSHPLTQSHSVQSLSCAHTLPFIPNRCDSDSSHYIEPRPQHFSNEFSNFPRTSHSHAAIVQYLLSQCSLIRSRFRNIKHKMSTWKLHLRIFIHRSSFKKLQFFFRYLPRDDMFCFELRSAACSMQKPTG